jgi:DNA-binding NtrC family response regulator
MTPSRLGHLLVVDDEVELMNALREGLTDQNYDVVGVTSGQEGLKVLTEQPIDLLLSDLMMPDMDGIQLLRRALAIDPQLVGIIMTGQGTIQTAVEAMKLGAFDYVLKPFKLHMLLPILARAMDVRRLRLENVRLRQYLEQLSYESPRYHLVGSSLAMQKVVQLIEKVAPTDATVLVRGPSGTGKELVARALHHNSPRRDHALVTINCAALQENLLESELFGHEKGAFTGAVQTKPGLIEVAEGSTLFIDEIAEMTPALQAKLLRVLEDGHYRRVGSTRESRANVRVIAATNKPLEEEQQAGRFREDLYYRLNVVSISLPPLRERRQDIPELINHFLTTRQLGKVPYQVHPEAVQALVRYDWPGNVRELANVLERAQILAEGQCITVDDLPESLVTHPPQSRGEAADSLQLQEVERRHVNSVLQQMNGNKVHAAKTLGISRRALYRLIEKYHLEAKHPADRPTPGKEVL